MERGQMVFLFAASFATIMLLLTLMVDFGGMARQYQRGQIAIDAAAAAAAQAVDLPYFYRTNVVRLSPGEAASRAGQYASINSGGRVVVTGVYAQDDQVWVTGVTTYRSFFAHYLGLGEVTMHLRASARPAWGINFQLDE
jgi:uncharacterized membrane protein